MYVYRNVCVHTNTYAHVYPQALLETAGGEGGLHQASLPKPTVRCNGNDVTSTMFFLGVSIAVSQILEPWLQTSTWYFGTCLISASTAQDHHFTSRFGHYLNPWPCKLVFCLPANQRSRSSGSAA